MRCLACFVTLVILAAADISIAQQAKLDTGVAAAHVLGTSNLNAAVRIWSIAARDARGRIQRFLDSGNREFSITYNDAGRLVSAKATRGQHFSDLLNLSYDGNGRVIGAAFRSGYLIVIRYGEDGTQKIGDQFGGMLSRKGSVDRGYSIVQIVDPGDHLKPAIEGIDALLAGRTVTSSP